jgi:hypothetical protein
MIHLVLLLVLLAAMVATVILVVSRPLKLLAKIQIVLTALVVIAFAVGFKMALWLHSMAFSNPVRQHWQPKLSVVGNILWFGTIIPWLLFTIFHVIVIMRRKVRANSN